MKIKLKLKIMTTLFVFFSDAESQPLKHRKQNKLWTVNDNTLQRSQPYEYGRPRQTETRPCGRVE